LHFSTAVLFDNARGIGSGEHGAALVPRCGFRATATCAVPFYQRPLAPYAYRWRGITLALKRRLRRSVAKLCGVTTLSRCRMARRQQAHAAFKHAVARIWRAAATKSNLSGGAY